MPHSAWGPSSGRRPCQYILNARIPLVSIFIVSAPCSEFCAVIFAFTKFPRVRQEPEKGAHAGMRLLRQPLLLLMTGVLMLYVGTEIGISSWSSEYVVKVLGVSASTGASAVALFWLGLLAGRLAISFGYGGSRQELLMLALSVVSAAALVGVLLARSAAAVAVAVFIAGLGSSGFYPLGMSMLGRHFKSGVAVGTAATGGAAGSIMFPFGMALISQSVGIRTGFWFYLGMSVLLIALTLFSSRLVRRGAVPVILSLMKDKEITTYGYKWVVLAGFMLVAATNQGLWITFAPITSDAMTRLPARDGLRRAAADLQRRLRPSKRAS